MLRICSFLVLILGLSGSVSSASFVSGVARVIDGDTLEVAGVRVRLFGIDAPEIRQSCKTADGALWACGRWAREAVVHALHGRRLSCKAIARDRYARTVARCRAAGHDIGREFVRIGIAFAYRHYSTKYVGAENHARRARLGVWSGTFVKPWRWRHQRHATRARVSRARAPRSHACAIKGNISRSGHIYHLPGGRWYAKTRINPARGERWFCSVAQARAAGWRRPG